MLQIFFIKTKIYDLLLNKFKIVYIWYIICVSSELSFFF